MRSMESEMELVDSTASDLSPPNAAKSCVTCEPQHARSYNNLLLDLNVLHNGFKHESSILHALIHRLTGRTVNESDSNA